MKNLNVEKLSKSGFSNRVLDFVKEYEKARNIKLYDTVADWFIEEKYECIKAFLISKPRRYFAGMNTLLNKKDNLYKEFMSFYE